jgi:hypothetical protein
MLPPGVAGGSRCDPAESRTARERGDEKVHVPSALGARATA